jgi:hypothetical protein
VIKLGCKSSRPISVGYISDVTPPFFSRSWIGKVFAQSSLSHSSLLRCAEQQLHRRVVMEVLATRLAWPLLLKTLGYSLGLGIAVFTYKLITTRMSVRRLASQHGIVSAFRRENVASRCAAVGVRSQDSLELT